VTVVKIFVFEASDRDAPAFSEQITLPESRLLTISAGLPLPLRASPRILGQLAWALMCAPS
jgi:hypothetical protein